jgi:hypothetical protein
MAVAYLGKQRYQIISYKDQKPVVMSSDGHRMTTMEPRISIVPGKDYAAGLITIDQFSGISDGGSASDSLNSGLNISVRFAADRDLADVFVIFMVFEADPTGAYDEVPQVAFKGTSAGALKAGVMKDMSFHFDGLSSQRTMRCVPLFFVGGAQVNTAGGNAVLNGIFDVVDRVGLRRVIGERKSGDFPMSVYRRFPLNFDGRFAALYQGKTVNVTVNITPEGHFWTLGPVAAADQDLADDLSGQLQYWLFVPKISKGRPEATTIVVPLKF